MAQHARMDVFRRRIRLTISERKQRHMAGTREIGLSAEAKQKGRILDPDSLLGLAAVFTIGTGLIGLAAVLLGRFDATGVALAGLLLTAASVFLMHDHFSAGVAPRWRDIACLLVAALCFRVPAYNYVLGGQDEGLYVNIANTIERTGGLAIRDVVGEKLRGTAQLDVYRRDNRSTYVLQGKT